MAVGGAALSISREQNSRFRGSWTAERMARLRSLVEQRLSTAEIAILMGISRNAVCGAVFRSKITLTASTPARRGKRVASPPRKKKPEAAPPPLLVNLKPAPFVAREAKGVTARLVTLNDLKQGDCRWPYGDGPFHFCGCECAFGASYCAGHAKLSARAA